MSHPNNPHPAWPEERLAALLRRGLGCANRAAALQALRHLDGQLFEEYCALLARPGASGREFLSGVSFAAALEVYRFDAALRVLLFDAIQTIEMSLRAQWAHGPAEIHGPRFYTNPAHFRGRTRQGWNHSEALATLHHSYQRRQEVLGWASMRQLLPPASWEVVGTMSLGQLSRWFRYLRRREDREVVARAYAVDEAVLRGFLPSMVAVRNICAHHNLLYGGDFRFLYTRTSEEPEMLRESCAGGGDGTLYPVATFMAFMLLQIDGAAHGKFVRGLQELFAECETADPRRLGFPRHWWRRPVWRF